MAVERSTRARPEAPPTSAATCRDEAIAARCLDAASTCERQFVRLQAPPLQEELVPPLLSRRSSTPGDRGPPRGYGTGLGSTRTGDED